MNKTLLLATMLATTLCAGAQHRFRIENATDYSKPVVSRHNRIGSLATAPIPNTGSPRIPVVLVEFPNQKFMQPDIYDKFCNGNMDGTYYTGHGSQGSVRDYFATVSDNQFTPLFDVIGPVCLSNDYQYYGEDASDTSYDKNIGKFYSEACSMAAQKFGVDWSKFDNNGDGKVDFVFFVYAGEGQNSYGSMKYDAEHSGLIWPKEVVSSMTVDLDGGGSVTFGAFGCTNEAIEGASSLRLDGIGTFCHELSHGLGLCDHYDYNYKLFGMDYWDLMDSGCYCRQSYWPCGYSAYELDFMEWRKLHTIEMDKPQTLVLTPIGRGGVGYKLVNKTDPDDYYVLEYRHNSRYDAYIGVPHYTTNPSNIAYGLGGNTHGLMVYRIIYDQSVWARNRLNTGSEHMLLIAADGEKIPYQTGRLDRRYYISLLGDLYPGSQNVTALTLFGQNIEVIENNDGMTLTLNINGGDPNVNVDAIATDASSDGPYYDLSGRRVMSPSRGIYVKNGKKVLIK